MGSPRKNNCEVTTVQTRTDLSLDGLQELFQPPRLSKPEMHLLLKPFFLLDRHGDRAKPIEYVYSVIDAGKAVTRSWCVQPHFKYGLPTAFDRDVTIALYELVNEKYFAGGKAVPKAMAIGSIRDFLDRMGLAVSGQNVKAVKESLRRLAHTLCTCEETFFDNAKKRYIGLTFRLLQGYGFVGESDGNGGKHEENFVIFDDAVLSNLNTGYVMVIDLENFRRLRTDIAKQLYTHLAYRFYCRAEDGSEQWIADYQWLAIHLGVSVLPELKRAKSQLKAAHEELLNAGYISEYKWDGWRILYRPGHVWKGEQLRRQSGNKRHGKPAALPVANTANVPEDGPGPAHDPLIPILCAFANGLSFAEERLAEAGLTVDQAAALCREKDIPMRRQSTTWQE